MMRYSPSLTVLILITLLLSGCISTPTHQGTVSISSNITTYSPVMSTTVGFDLSPFYSEPVPELLQYHWTAAYGTFVTWNAPDFKVVDLGQDAITSNGTVYWTYLPVTPGEEPAEVVIRLSVENPRTGEVLAKTEKILVKDSTGYHIEK